MSSKKEILWLRDINIIDDSIEKLSSYNLTVFEGEIICIISNNPIYKRLLSDIILGYSIPESGLVSIHEKVCENYTPRVAYINGISTSDSTNSLIDSMTIEDNLFAIRERRNPFRIYNKRAAGIQTRNILKKFNMENLGKITVRDLSICQKQLVCLAKAVINQSKLIVIKNTSINYTREEQSLFIKNIKEFSSLGISIVIFCEELNKFSNFADKIQIITDRDDYYEFNSSDRLEDFLINNSYTKMIASNNVKNSKIDYSIKINRLIKKGKARIIEQDIDKYFIYGESILKNVCLGSFPKISNKGVIKKEILNFIQQELIEFIYVQNINTPLQELSRLQKISLLIFREMLIHPNTLVIENPFRDMDENDGLFLLNNLKQLTDKGIDIYLIHCRNHKELLKSTEVTILDHRTGFIAKKDTN